MQKTHVLGNATAFSNACHFLLQEHGQLWIQWSYTPPPTPTRNFKFEERIQSQANSTHKLSTVIGRNRRKMNG